MSIQRWNGVVVALTLSHLFCLRDLDAPELVGSSSAACASVDLGGFGCCVFRCGALQFGCSKVGLHSSDVPMWGFTVRVFECGALQFGCSKVVLYTTGVRVWGAVRQHTRSHGVGFGQLCEWWYPA